MSAVVRIAVNSTIESFRSLPSWAQASAASTLVQENLSLFQALVAQKQVPGLPGKEGVPVPPSRPVVKSTERREKAVNAGESSPAIPAGSKVKKTKGFLRPSVRSLEFAIRLKDHPEGYTEQKADQLLLSCALAAADRGRAEGCTEEAIAVALAQARASQSSYARLWPSHRTQRKWAEKLASEQKAMREPRSWEVGNHTLVLTRHSTPAVNVMEGEGVVTVPVIRKLDITEFSFHSNQGLALDLSKETVKRFLLGLPGNYDVLDKFVHGFGQYVGLRWLNERFGILRWGDEGEEIHPQASPVKKPKKKLKKRKRNT